MTDLLCMGEPMLEFSELPPGPDGRVLYLQGYGGDTSNVAIAAARQGARAGYMTALGDDMAGQRFRALWQTEGVDDSAVLTSARGPTGVYFVTHDEAGHHFLYYRTGSAASFFAPADLSIDAIAGARIFHASGISQAVFTSAADAVFAAIAIARAHGTKVSFDTNYRPRLWPAARAAAVIHAAIALADYAFPGMEDAAALTGLTDPDAVLDFYLRLGAKLVVLKMGEDGAYVADADQRTRIPPFRVQLVDAGGAGDTFCGAFLARTLAGDEPVPAARYAAMAAALTCTGHGTVAPIPTKDQVLAALASRSEKR